uniref:Uncharacterized protein n=1 Tax=Timema cristinae TaxID=61476 RepID=A0A7R9H2G0_TIMCR|nr:unnamed protein product [Timema cristinae]
MKFLESEVEGEDRIKIAVKTPPKGTITAIPDKSKGLEKISQENLEASELEKAEIRLMSFIQKKCFLVPSDKRFSSLNPLVEDGVLRFKTRPLLREDVTLFKFPMILPAHHVVVSLLIMEEYGCPTSLHKQLKDLADVHRLDDPSTTDGAEKGCLQAFVPLLTVQQSSPPKNIPPVLYIPGSPPPRAAGSSNAEIESFFPEKMPGRPLKELDKPMSLDLPYPTPQITVTCNMSEMESDTESMSTANNSLGVHPRNPSGGGGMCYLSPFSMCSRVDRTASESNLSSSGYSSMASPGPSRCGSNSPLCPTEVEDQPGPVTTLFKIVQHNPSPLLYTLTGTNEIETMKSGKTQHSQGQEISFKGRSDSETLSDDLFVESNDEGIGTDHLDEKIEEGELKSAKEMEMFIGKEILDNGKILLGLPILGATTVGLSVPNQGTVDNVSDTCKCISLSSNKGKSCLQLPSIVIQNDIVSTHENHLIPVNSLSESPQSDKMIGPGKFSPQFYGRRIDKLLSTDSDDLYDCLSSDCPKVPTGSGSTPQHRKSTGRRRERRATVRGGSKTPSPTKATIMLDVPEKDVYYHPTVPRKPSPKRTRMKPQGPVESSSSSESLSSISEPRPLESVQYWQCRDVLVDWSLAETGQLGPE